MMCLNHIRCGSHTLCGPLHSRPSPGVHSTSCIPSACPIPHPTAPTALTARPRHLAVCCPPKHRKRMSVSANRAAGPALPKYEGLAPRSSEAWPPPSPSSVVPASARPP